MQEVQLVEQELHQVLRQVLHQVPQALAGDPSDEDQVQAGPADNQVLLDAWETTPP